MYPLSHLIDSSLGLGRNLAHAGKKGGQEGQLPRTTSLFLWDYEALWCRSPSWEIIPKSFFFGAVPREGAAVMAHSFREGKYATHPDGQPTGRVSHYGNTVGRMQTKRWLLPCQVESHPPRDNQEGG